MPPALRRLRRNLLDPALRRLGVPALQPVEYATGAPPRVLFYCASNIGLGHLGRVCRVADIVSSTRPDASLLLASDFRESAQFPALDKMGRFHLPAFEFSGGQAFRETPKSLRIESRQLGGLRRNALLALAHSFRPHVAYMDTLPHGKRDEMLPALRQLAMQEPPCRRILCLRDIPCATGDSFKFMGDEPEILGHASFYDRMLIAGDSRFFDPVSEYRWPEALASKSEFIGFVVEGEAGDGRVGALDGSAQPTIVASFGGGWEAGALGHAMLRACRQLRDPGDMNPRLELLTGPAMDSTEWESLQMEAAGDPQIRIQRFDPDFPRILKSADLAVLQAGSTPFQILESDIPILLLHREYKDREQEQRAGLLARYAGIRRVSASEIEQGGLGGLMRQALLAPRAARRTGLRFDGARVAAERILEQLERP